MDKILVSVIIPAYHEQLTLEQIVKHVLSVNVKYYSFEIIIVDDGSEDETGKIADNLAKKYQRVTSIHHRYNQGKGAAVATGLKHSSGQIVLIQDADLEYNPKDFKALLKPFKNPKIHVVYGTREKIARRGIYSHILFYWGGEFLSHLANWLYGLKISDEASGYKVFRRWVLESIKLEATGFDFCPEVTAKSALLGINIVEVPIRYQPRHFDEGKKIRAWDGAVAIWTLLKLAFIGSNSNLTAGLEVTSRTRNYNNWIWQKINQHIGRYVFEAGAGLGTFADLILDKKPKNMVLGEVDTHYLKYLIRKYAHFPLVKVQKVDIASRQVLKLSPFDSIVSINVLEHIKNDSLAISHMVNLLVPGGKLVIFIPAMPILFSQWDRSIGHYRRYTKPEIEDKLKKVNLKIVSCQYFNALGFLGWGLNKIFKQTPTNRSVKSQIIWFDRLIVPWWSKLEALFPLPFGQSLLVVAQKSY